MTQQDTPKRTHIIDAIEIQTAPNPCSSVIWLHGLGADGHDFESLVPQLQLSEDLPLRFIFPHAPFRRITANGGMMMRGWYDIIDMPIDIDRVQREDRAGITQSAQMVYRLIERENQRGIASEQIFLAGFSQGGAVALFAGLRLKTRLAGIIALSTYIPEAHTLATEKSSHNQTTPIFIGHGTDDPLIPLSIATHSHQLLLKQDYHVEWHTYPMPHSLHSTEITDIAHYLKKYVPSCF